MDRRSLAVVTAGYWAFTVTDGALRMLVLLYFHSLGYSPVAIAFLFVLYEVMGIATNLVGGWVGAEVGLNRTLAFGLGLQVIALMLLTIHDDSWPELASVGWVMGLQALSGIAKDLTKLSSKASMKFLAPDSALFRVVAVLTGSKNALKGVGFFVGAALLDSVGFDAALSTLAALVGAALAMVVALLRVDLGRAASKPPLRSVLSKSTAINRLSFARLFLFGARDIWFVVALPVFLADELGWSHRGVGGFVALWVIGYGIVQSVADRVVRPDLAFTLVAGLGAITAAIAVGVELGVGVTTVVIAGLVVFGVVFALNSSLHSFLVLDLTAGDNVALDVGFYYSANAAGRLIGTVVSGLLAMWAGLSAAMWGSTLFLVVAATATAGLERQLRS